MSVLKSVHRKSPLFCVILIVLLCTHLSSAQSIKPISRFTFSGGYSFHSMKFLGKTPNSQTEILTLGYQRQIRSYSNSRHLWYTAGVIPFIHFEYPKRDEGNRISTRAGFGISPVGFLVTEERFKHFTPFIQTTGGIIYMNDYFPTDQSRRLNFTFDITIGGNVALTHGLGLSLGYKFHHISNAETGNENPGLDSNFLLLSLTIQ